MFWLDFESGPWVWAVAFTSALGLSSCRVGPHRYFYSSPRKMLFFFCFLPTKSVDFHKCSFHYSSSHRFSLLSCSGDRGKRIGQSWALAAIPFPKSAPRKCFLRILPNLSYEHWQQECARTSRSAHTSRSTCTPKSAAPRGFPLSC